VAKGDGITIKTTLLIIVMICFYSLYSVSIYLKKIKNINTKRQHYDKMGIEAHM